MFVGSVMTSGNKYKTLKQSKEASLRCSVAASTSITVGIVREALSDGPQQQERAYSAEVKGYDQCEPVLHTSRLAWHGTVRGAPVHG
jgi:hypothetical protein